MNPTYCVICESPDLEPLKRTAKEYWVIGDRRIFIPCEDDIPHLYRVICKNCGAVQFCGNQVYNKVADDVFSDYGVLHNDFCNTAHVKHQISRLDKIYRLLYERTLLPNAGRWLDIGCGGGESFLRFSQYWPKWKMFGMDQGSQFRELAIKNGAREFFSSLNELKKANIRWDFISMSAVLYAVNNTNELFGYCHEYMANDGFGLWVDGCFDIQPWVIPEIEARTLFTRNLMKNILHIHDFEIICDIYDGKGKDVGYVFRHTGQKNTRKDKGYNDSLYETNKMLYENSIDFINHSVDFVLESVASFSNIGIFGTSLAGMYFLQLLREYYGNKNIFFVDEQASEIGKHYYDVPVLSPSRVKEAAVIMPFPAYVADDIKQRMNDLNYLDNCELIFCVQ